MHGETGALADLILAYYCAAARQFHGAQRGCHLYLERNLAADLRLVVELEIHAAYADVARRAVGVIEANGQGNLNPFVLASLRRASLHFRIESLPLETWPAVN